MAQSSAYRAVWRWHFYAGLFVMPFMLILAVTGAFYLFKPQVDRWEERAWQNYPVKDAVSADIQVAAALRAFPGAKMHSYRLPQQPGDAALIHLALTKQNGTKEAASLDKVMRDVFVSPQGRVVGSLDPDRRLMALDQRIHGQLLLGKPGSWVVELAASWAIVMVLTGLYLWWPRGRGLGGTFWPRLNRGSSVMWRDLHAVSGIWVSGFALALLLTGLPWADVWGSAFKTVRAEFGWVSQRQDWTIGGRDSEHASHDHAAMVDRERTMPELSHRMPDGTIMTTAPVSLSTMVAKAKAERLEFPVTVNPPDLATHSVWTVKSDTQNRPRRVSMTYHPVSGAELSREVYSDKHIIDQVVGYGIAWHEGALFGVVNQVIGLATAMALVGMSVTGFVLWRRRKPSGLLGAPPTAASASVSTAIKLAVALLLAFLPLFALSAVLIWLAERFVLRRLPAAARWLGLSALVSGR